MSHSISGDSLDHGEGDAAIEIRAVRKVFGGLVAVDVEELAVSRHGVTAMIGPNGAGKTTLFDIISGFVRSTSGTVVYEGTDISSRPAQWRARRGLVRTFQMSRSFERLTVLENLLIGAMPDKHFSLLRSSTTPWVAFQLERDSVGRARELIDRVGLTRVTDLPAASLSGGQRKLVEFARALMARPRLLLLDEPFAGVNPALRERMSRYIREYADEGNGLLVVEHDLPRVMELADNVIVLDRGQVLAEGSPASIRADEAVIEAYLGGGGKK